MMSETGQIIKLTLVLYKITEDFPKEEPLRRCTREKAINVLEDLIEISSFCVNKISGLNVKAEKALANIKTVRAFLEIAKFQDWTNKNYIAVLDGEYEKTTFRLETLIKQGLREQKRESPVQKPTFSQKINNQTATEGKEIAFLEGKERCKKIIDFLKRNHAAQVMDLQKLFPKVTKRTLRRDFEFLLDKGLVKRRGERNNTQYVLR